MAGGATEQTDRSIPGPECRPCLRRLVEDALGARGLAQEQASQLRRQAGEMIDRGLARGRTPALVASDFLAHIAGESGVADPFAAKKRQDNQLARRAVAQLGPLPDRFGDRCRAALLGNALDHFLVPDAAEMWQGRRGAELAIDQLAAAEACLSPGALVVILADNAGEQCFDRLLVEHLTGRGCRVSYVVKSGPMQNDLTWQDLAALGEEHGLGRVVASGHAKVGLDPGSIPTALAQLLGTAALVIAKGMGHYETLRRAAAAGELPWPLLMLFMAKCPVVARHLGVPRGAGAALFSPGRGAG